MNHYKTYQVIVLRDDGNVRFTFNQYVRTFCPYIARKTVGLHIIDSGATDLHVLGVRVLRDAATAHNYRSIFENNARFVA